MPASVRAEVLAPVAPPPESSVPVDADESDAVLEDDAAAAAKLDALLTRPITVLQKATLACLEVWLLLLLRVRVCVCV